MKQGNFICPECCELFLSANARNGHIGAAHSRQYLLKEIVHGTTAGYKAHRRRSEKACSDCLRAWRKKYQKHLKGGAA